MAGPVIGAILAGFFSHAHSYFLRNFTEIGLVIDDNLKQEKERSKAAADAKAKEQADNEANEANKKSKEDDDKEQASKDAEANKKAEEAAKKEADDKDNIKE